MAYLRITFALVCLSLSAGFANGQVWQRLGPPGGNVTSLAEAIDGTVYLGTPDGHVFSSSDQGDHWQIRGRVGDRLDAVVSRIAADRRNSRRLLAAVWFQDSSFGGGVFESIDGGSSWKRIGLSGEAVRALEPAPSDPQVWVAGTRSGIFRSRNDGQTWERSSPADDEELKNIDSLAVDPADPETIYVGTYHLPWKTTDGGKTWLAIGAGMIDDSDVMSLHIDFQNPRRIYSSACSGIYRSDDAGATWLKLQGVPYQSRRTQQIVQDRSNPSVVLAATTAGLWQSEDAGENWHLLTDHQAVVNAVLILSAGSKMRILAGLEADGVAKSDDGGSIFIPSNTGFSHRVLVSLVARPGDSSHLLAYALGRRDLLLESDDGGTAWRDFAAGTPKWPIRSILMTSSGWWAALASGGVAYSSVDHASWSELPFRDSVTITRGTARRSSPSPKSRPRTVFPHVTSILELETVTLAATDEGIWQKPSGKSEFHRAPAKGVQGTVIGLISTAHSVGGRELLALTPRALHSSLDDGRNWRSLAIPTSGEPFLWIYSDPRNQHGRLLLGTRQGVYVSDDRATWRLLANGLPAIGSQPPLRLGGSLFLAMENGGIYESGSEDLSWQRIDHESERGRAASLLGTASGALLVASQSEGLLRYGKTIE